jgi:hypothetical protein
MARPARGQPPVEFIRRACASLTHHSERIPHSCSWLLARHGTRSPLVGDYPLLLLEHNQNSEANPHRKLYHARPAIRRRLAE